jgi:hypothetical protein
MPDPGLKIFLTRHYLRYIKKKALERQEGDIPRKASPKKLMEEA